jgi:hypothetical protein
MRLRNLGLGLALLLVSRAALAAEVPLTTSNWVVFSGTGSLANVADTVPGLGTVSVLKSQPTNGLNMGFIQKDYGSLNQAGRYVRATLKSSSHFILYVRARATNGQDYYLAYSSYLRPVGIDALGYFNFTFSADYPNRLNRYLTYTIDVQRDLERMLPGFSLSYIRWVAVRGAMNLGSLEILDTVDYLFTDDDGDLLAGVAEDAQGTSPFLRDSDGDGVADGLEAVDACGNALNAAVPSNLDADPDGDGLTTRVEMFLGSDCNFAGPATLPTRYGWLAYYPQREPAAGTMTVDGDGALVLNHADPNPIRFGVYSPEFYGPLRLPNYLQAYRSNIRFQAKSAEMFYVFVRVVGSDNQQYYLAYSPDTAPPSSGGGYFYYPLGGLGYSFTGGAYTAVGRNLSQDLSAMLPGVTVQQILWVCVRGRLAIKDIGFEDNTPPIVGAVAATPSPAGVGAVVGVSFTVGEPLGSRPAVTVGGRAAAYVSDDGVTYHYAYTVQPGDASGPAAVAVAATDAAGNTGTGSASVMLDTALPYLLGALGVAPSPAKAGDTLTLQFTASEPLGLGSGLTVDGNATYLVAVTGDTFTLGYLVTGLETEGAVAAELTLADLAMNVSTATQPVIFDFTAPVVSSLIAYMSPAKEGDVISIAFDVSELPPVNPVVTVGGRPATFGSRVGGNYGYSRTLDGTETEGAFTEVKVMTADTAGNPGTGSVYITTDFTPPNFTNLTPAFPAGTTGTVVAFSVDHSEPLPFGVSATVGGNPATYQGTSGATDYFTYTLGGWEPEGGLPVVVSGADGVGHWSNVSVGAVVADYRPPAISGVSLNPLTGRQGQTVTIGFSLGETVPVPPVVTLDGFAASFVSRVGNTYSFTYTLTGAENNGGVPVQIRAWDAVGNLGLRNLLFLVDAPPFVSLTNPAAGAGGVTVTTSVRAQFNEPMDAATVNAASFVLSGGPAVGTVSYDAPSRVATFTLTGGNTLAYDTLYTVTLTTALKDAGGNALAAAHVFTFRTAALGMASIAGSLAAPPAWTRPRVVEVMGNHLGTVSGATYQINVDRRPDNLVYAWNDVNNDGAWQAGAEERLFAADCNAWPMTERWDTTRGNVAGANIGYRRIVASLTVPGAWNAKVYEAATGNQAVIAGGDYTLNLDQADNRHVRVFDDANANGVRDAAESEVQSAYDPVNTCMGMVPPLNFGIRQISGRVTEPTAPFLDLVAAGSSTDGPFTYAAPQGAARDYAVFADVGYGSTYVFAFDDANANGAYDAGEVRVPVSSNPVNLTRGDVAKAYIFRRKISGNVPAAPASWTHARVIVAYDTYAADVPAAGGAYALWAPARPNMELYWFNDANGNYKYDLGEEAVRYVYLVNTLYGDLTNINFTALCAVSGTFTPPANWAPGYVFTHLEAVTYATATSAPVSGGAYLMAAQPGAASLRLVAYEDTNRDGRFDTATDRHLGYETNDFSNVGACNLTGKNFALARTVGGAVFTPPGWATPRIQVQASDTYDPGLNSVAIAGAVYTVRAPASRYNSVWMFDDRNGDGVRQDSEPYLTHASQFDTRFGNQAGANFYARTVSGFAVAPIDALNPKVGSGGVAVKPAANGWYVLTVNDAYQSVGFWDDASGDDRMQWGVERVYGWAGADTTLQNQTLNFNLYSIAGHVNAPPTWSNVGLDVDNAGWGVTPDGKFVAWVTDGYHNVRMFEDLNGNGRWEWSEPSVQLPNGVTVAGANVTGVNLTYPTVSGTVMVPPTFTRPLVGTIMGGDTVHPVAPSGGSFSLPAYYGWIQLGLFDDVNGSGFFEWGEPVIRNAMGFNVTGDQGGVSIVYRTISGSVNFPPTWSRPQVYAQSFGGALNGVTAGGSYTVYTDASSWVTVGMYDDVALQNAYVWSDPAINQPSGIDTTLGDVSGIDLTYRTISGTVGAGVTAGWIRPRIEIQGASSYAEDLAGGAFTLYVSPWAGPYNPLGAYDDLNTSQAKDTYEPGRAYHTGPGCPAASVDVSLGDVTGLVIDGACGY